MRMVAFFIFAFFVAFSSLYVSAVGSRELAGGARAQPQAPINLTVRCIKKGAPPVEIALACIKSKRKTRDA